MARLSQHVVLNRLAVMISEDLEKTASLQTAVEPRPHRPRSLHGPAEVLTVLKELLGLPPVAQEPTKDNFTTLVTALDKVLHSNMTVSEIFTEVSTIVRCAKVGNMAPAELKVYHDWPSLTTQEKRETFEWLCHGGPDWFCNEKYTFSDDENRQCPKCKGTWGELVRS